MNKIGFLVVSVSAIAALGVSSCAPVGVAMGAGATLGIAASQEGGIESAADDLRIKTLISEKWFSHNVDTFRKLKVTVDQGRVLITGVVQNPDERVEAVRLAWQVKGVKQVINEIRVANSEGIKGFVTDGWITTRLRTTITFDSTIQSINYSIDTVQGTVYLMGVSENQAELDRVIHHARSIPGVREVISYVKPRGQRVEDTYSPTLTPSSSTQAPETTGPAPINNSVIDKEPL